MRLNINTTVAHKYGLQGAIVWAAFEKILDESNWRQIRVSQLVSMTDKIFSETPIKVAIRKMEADGLIERISDPASDGAKYRFGLNSAPYCRKRPLQIVQPQSP
jgi:hypothetical protein